MSEFLNGRALLDGKYLSLVPVIRIEAIRDFELLNLIKDGLQPYNQAGEPIDIEKVNTIFEKYRLNLQLKSLSLSWDVNYHIQYRKILCDFLFKEQDVRKLGLIVTYSETSELANQEIAENSQAQTEPKRLVSGDYVFRQEGDIYKIVFAGKPLPFSKLLGLAYIHILMQNQPNEISVLKVAGMAGRLAGDYFNNKYKEGLETTSSMSDPIIDDKGTKFIQQKREDLKDRLDEAEMNNNYELANNLREELEELDTTVLKEYGGLHRNPFKRRKDPKSSEYTARLEAARRPVSSAITRAINWMREYDENLAEHFAKSIVKGKFPCYRPIQSLNWQLE